MSVHSHGCGLPGLYHLTCMHPAQISVGLYMAKTAVSSRTSFPALIYVWPGKAKGLFSTAAGSYKVCLLAGQHAKSSRLFSAEKHSAVLDMTRRTSQGFECLWDPCCLDEGLLTYDRSLRTGWTYTYKLSGLHNILTIGCMAHGPVAALQQPSFKDLKVNMTIFSAWSDAFQVFRTYVNRWSAPVE